MAIVLVLAAIAVAGCGTSKPAGAGTSGVVAAPSSAPLTLAQVARISSSDPASTVMRVWFWGEWGSLPNVAASYDPGTVNIAGQANIFQVYAIQRSTLLEFRPHVVDDGIRGGTAFVAVQGTAAGQKPYSASFDLRRVGNVWLITHDSLLEGTLPGALAALLDPTGHIRAQHPAQFVKQSQTILERIRSYASTFTRGAAQAGLTSVGSPSKSIPIPTPARTPKSKPKPTTSSSASTSTSTSTSTTASTSTH